MSDYLRCGERACRHPAETHWVMREEELPAALWAAPCILQDCLCLDYDGASHPERPSLADLEVYREDDGSIGVRSTSEGQP